MFAGEAGVGKTCMLRDRVHSVDPEVFSVREICLNAYTDSHMLQMSMEIGLEKRTGKIFGPRSSRKLVYFLDDINMPLPDEYGTQQTTALLRQQLEYGFWYDRYVQVTSYVHVI
jgi:dynein heavy chain